MESIKLTMLVAIILTLTNEVSAMNEHRPKQPYYPCHTVLWRWGIRTGLTRDLPPERARRTSHELLTLRIERLLQISWYCEEYVTDGEFKQIQAYLAALRLERDELEQKELESTLKINPQPNTKTPKRPASPDLAEYEQAPGHDRAPKRRITALPLWEEYARDPNLPPFAGIYPSMYTLPQDLIHQ